MFLLYRHVCSGQVRANGSAKHHQWHQSVLIVQTQAQCDIITTGHDATQTHTLTSGCSRCAEDPLPEVHSRHAFLADPWPRTTARPLSLLLTSDLWPLAVCRCQPLTEERAGTHTADLRQRGRDGHAAEGVAEHGKTCLCAKLE